MKIAYWDNVLSKQCERDATEEEIDSIQKTIDGSSFEQKNFEILLQLKVNDEKSIRALRDGDEGIISMLREQAASLRQQLIKD